ALGCGPGAGRTSWLDRARCGAELAGLAEFQFPDCSNFLVESKERRYLQPCRAVAAIPDRFSTGIDEHPHQWRWSLQPATISKSRNGNAVDHTSSCESLQHC